MPGLLDYIKGLMEDQGQQQSPPAGLLAPGTPMPQASSQEQAPQAQSPSFFDSIGNVANKVGDAAGNIYGKGGAGDPLIALGAGLLSNQGRLGPGLIQGMNLINQQNLIGQSRQYQNAQNAQRIQALRGNAALVKKYKPELSDDEAGAIAQNPTMMSEIFRRSNPSEAWKQETDEQGNIWQTNSLTGQRQLLKGSPAPQHAELKDIRQPDGSIQQMWVKPGESGVAVGAPLAPNAIDPQELSKQRAKNQAQEELAISQKGVAAEMMLPSIERAEKAYKRLAEMNAVGPISASSANRLIGGISGTEAETMRQEYEAASKELELAKAQISMKGQGQITESERKILALTLPRLDAANAQIGIDILAVWRKAATGNLEKAGKSVPMSNAATGATPAKLASKAEYDAPVQGAVPGLLQAGNIDLNNRPIVKNPDGSISTVRSLSINVDGKEFLIPTVAADGSGVLSNQQAVDQFRKTGQHLGVFSTSENASAYAKKLHESQASKYLPQSSQKNPPGNKGGTTENKRFRYDASGNLVEQ